MRGMHLFLAEKEKRQVLDESLKFLEKRFKWTGNAKRPAGGQLIAN